MSPIRLPVVLSPTRAELGSRCFRRHWLADVVDRRSYNSPAAAFGTVLHMGVGAWWKGADATKAQAALKKSWKKLRPTGDNHSYEMAVKLLENYIKNVSLAGPLPGVWHILQLEERANVEIEGMFDSFQLDRLLENTKGDIALIDLKSASRINQRWRDGWQTSLQMKLYRRGVEKLGFEFRNFYLLVEGVQKSAKWVQEYAMCPEWDADTLDEAEKQWLRVAREDDRLLKIANKSALERSVEPNWEIEPTMREEAEKLGVTETAFNYGDCYSYFFPCPYLDLCIASPKQRFSMLQTFDIKPSEGY